MAKYDARLTLATVEGLTGRISLSAHQIGTRCAKSFMIPTEGKEPHQQQNISDSRVEALTKLAELEVDVKALRKMLTLMERNSA